MTELFGYSLDAITQVLLVATLCIVLAVAVRARLKPLLFRIAMRQLPRRRAQMVLVALGLALGSSIITSVFLTGDTVQTAINLQVVQGLGRIDEIVHDVNGPYTRGDVDLTNLTGLDVNALQSTSQAIFLDELSGSVQGPAQPAPQAYFPLNVYTSMRDALVGSSTIAALLPAAVEQHALVTDLTSRQIRGQVKILGVPVRPPTAFGSILDVRGRRIDVGSLAAGSAVVNATLAGDLGAAPGDRLLLFSNQHRVELKLQAVVRNGGLAGASPEILMSLAAVQAMNGREGQIDRILVVNRGADDAAAAAVSWAASDELYSAAPPYLGVDRAKAEGLRQAQQAQEIFARIFTLFALFTACVGLLLVFLIFAILAAERRPELGISRVVGMRRGDLVLMYVFEGTAYAVVSSIMGLAIGIGLGAGIVTTLNTILGQYGVTVSFVARPRVAALCVGLSLPASWLTVVFASWWATRLTISSAIRDLPEPGGLPPGPLVLLLRPWGRLRRRLRRRREARRIRWRSGMTPEWHVSAFEAWRRLVLEFPASVALALLAFCARGPGILVAGVFMAAQGVNQADTVLFELGLSIGIIGATLVLRTLLRLVRVRADRTDRVAFTLGGALLLADWTLPADAPTRIGLPALNTGIEIFFLGGVAMVLGAVWIAMYNLDAVVRPLARLPVLSGRLTIAVRSAAAYTLHRPLRTALILAMFSLVSFTVTVMAVVTDALQRTYGDVAAQTQGFDIRGDLLLYDSPLPPYPQALSQAPAVGAANFSFAGSQGFTPVGVVQLGMASTGWRLSYADVIDGDFLRGGTFHLISRARGYASDQAVWHAMRQGNGVALIGSDMLPGGTWTGLPSSNGVPPPYVFAAGATPGFAPKQVWLADPRGGPSLRLTIIGVADDADGHHGGIVVPAATFARGAIPPLPTTSYFTVKPGIDVSTMARRLGSAFLEHGFQTTVLADAVWAQRGPKILLARLLQGFVGLVMLLGIAGLAATAVRSVVERRQQIGMMRALGMPRRTIRLAFLLESSMVALAGLLIGVALGLVLARNLFLADFFEQYQTGLIMEVPWRQLALLTAVTYAASVIATLVPALLAGRVSPAEALLDL